jgi:hypothetical protein
MAQKSKKIQVQEFLLFSTLGDGANFLPYIMPLPWGKDPTLEDFDKD